MSAPLYGFGLSQEDERTERAALQLRDGDRVMAITSGGEMPLSLLTFGASHVTSVDVSPAQNCLARLKLAAALTLERDAAIGFIGYAARDVQSRRSDWRIVRASLSASDVSFWEGHRSALDGGAVWAGRFERYVLLLGRFVWPVIGRARLRGLFEQPDLAAQAAWFDRYIGTALLRGVFRVAFTPRLYSTRGVDPRSLSHHVPGESLGDRYFRQLRELCTRSPAQDNPLLQLVLLGHLLSTDRSHDWISKAGIDVLRARAGAITWVDGDLGTWLCDAPSASIDAFQLSNLADWVDDPTWEKLLTEIARVSAPGARAVWRAMHVDRPVPPSLTARLYPDRKLGERLRERDRFPFYTIVPAVFA